MIITDGKLRASVTMKEQRFGEWPDGNYAFEFFGCGALKQDGAGAYIVPDVDYCIEQAFDWLNHDGDYRGDENGNERMVDIVVHA